MTRALDFSRVLCLESSKGGPREGLADLADIWKVLAICIIIRQSLDRGGGPEEGQNTSFLPEVRNSELHSPRESRWAAHDVCMVSGGKTPNEVLKQN